MRFSFDKLLHGGDYNPDQWLDQPKILAKDIEMLKGAGCNVVTLGVFAWAALEPREGVFTLDWMGDIIDRLYENGIYTVLATPSGARPKWLADKYPEVLRTDESRRKLLFGGRHNHCLTSPVYREKTARIDKVLASRFGSHPGVILWHLSNELSGDCHCPMCQERFRQWLRQKYGTIEELNRKWVTAFWSHTYQDFSQIESPSSIGETAVHGLNLDWKRFITDMTREFVQCEIKAVRSASSLPVTTNFMYYFDGYNYADLAEDIDIVSWDTYPNWHKRSLHETALDNGMWHDVMRSLKSQPFLQMESSPTSTNWQGVSKLKDPGLLRAQSLQAIAHGGDGAMYFQVRQSAGSSEKFHGAIIDHYGEKDTRVYRETAQTGQALASLSCLAGTGMESQVLMIYDWENNWAREDAQGPRNDGLHFKQLCMNFYRGLRRLGLNVDLKDQTCDLSPYKLVIAPMVYLFRDDFDQKVKKYVEEGGTVVVTFWSGIVDESDRCFLGGTPHGLMEVLGLRSTEIDGLFDEETNEIEAVEGSNWPFSRKYQCRYLCELPGLTTAVPLMVYGKRFYAGTPALTVNSYGKGKAWYLAAHAEPDFYKDFLEIITKEAGIEPPVSSRIPEGLEITERKGDGCSYLIYQNFGEEAVSLPRPEEEMTVLYGNPYEKLAVYGTVVAARKRD